VVYFARGGIVAVQERIKPAPPGFDAAKTVTTGGTIFPGLIELHNHIAYNVLPLWRVPGKFTDRNRWADLPEKRRKVTAPMAVLAAPPSCSSRRPIRRVQVLFGGTTTTRAFASTRRWRRALLPRPGPQRRAVGRSALPMRGSIPDVAKKHVDAFFKT